MEAVLYDPERGYYSRRTPTEDFYTAPELHGAFADALAVEAAARLDALRARGVPGPYSIVEMGSGTGALARALLKSLKERRPDWAAQVAYLMVERCEGVLLDAVVSTAASGARVLGYSRLEDVPSGAGVFVSNELVDSFPAHVLTRRGGRILEVYVGEDGSESAGDLSTPALAPHAAAVAETLLEGERHSVCFEASRWLSQVRRALLAGSVVTVDYGKRFAPGVLNPPKAFYRHGHAPLTARPGRQDLSCPVDFEALIGEGRRLGFHPLAFTTLSRFLIDRGILESLPQGQDLEAYRERGRIKTLLHPEGMGEAFKVLIQEKRP